MPTIFTGRPSAPNGDAEKRAEEVCLPETGVTNRQPRWEDCRNPSAESGKYRTCNHHENGL